MVSFWGWPFRVETEHTADGRYLLWYRAIRPETPAWIGELLQQELELLRDRMLANVGIADAVVPRVALVEPAAADTSAPAHAGGSSSAAAGPAA